MKMQNLTMAHGDTFKFDVLVKSPSTGDSVNISGCSFWCTAKTAVADLDNAAIFQLTSPSNGIVITDAAKGVIQVTVPASATSGLARTPLQYFYDVQMKDGTGAVSTITLGILSVVPDVTISTT